MEKLKVFLDDVRQCPEGYSFVDNIDDCIELLERFPIAHLSLDHDLAHKSKNGLALVEYMVRNGLYADRITIHSANAAGGKAMYNSLIQAQENKKIPETVRIRLHPLPLYNKENKKNKR